MKSRIVFAAVVMLLTLAGCTSWWHAMSGDDPRHGVSSSLVDYLYPEGETPSGMLATQPHLTLPLHVGVAFVPPAYGDAGILTSVQRQQLLEKASAQFAGRPDVKRLTIIPDAYLRAGKGFATLDQITRLYGLDVLALVSYDQVAHVDDRTSSFLYWTVIGAYFVHGSQNDVQTFVDTAVFDAGSHELLFRAAGVNRIEATSTLIGSPEALRKARSESFALAMDDMTGNLATELQNFEQRVKAEKHVQISHSPGYRGGGGSFDSLLLLILGLLAGLRWWQGRRE